MVLSISFKGHTRAPGSWFSVFVTLKGVDHLDTKVSFDVWVKNDVGKMLVEDVVVTLVVAGNDKRWQDFSSAVDWEGFSDWQEFSAATGRKLQSLVGMLILLVALELEWLGVFLVRGSLIFLFVVILVDVLFEVVVAVAATAAAATPAALGAAAAAAALIVRDAQVDC